VKKVLTIVAICIMITLSIALIIQAAAEQKIERVIETKIEYVEIPKVKHVVETKVLTSNEPMEFLVTGYTAGPESTGKSPGHPQYGITYTGTKVREPGIYTPGTCAVDPNVIELGSTLYVEGYGLCKAEDIGGSVKGYHIDVYLETVEQVYKLCSILWNTYLLYTKDFQAKTTYS
jgi:3D (Asp-Asp-Asp) domain-containing protein